MLELENSSGANLSKSLSHLGFNTSASLSGCAQQSSSKGFQGVTKHRDSKTEKDFEVHFICRVTLSVTEGLTGRMLFFESDSDCCNGQALEVSLSK